MLVLRMFLWVSYECGCVTILPLGEFREFREFFVFRFVLAVCSLPCPLQPLT